MRFATKAERLSFSPMREASTSSRATASFSLTMGTAPAVEQVAQGVASVQVAQAVAEVPPREEHLGDDDIVPLEELVPSSA